MSRPFLLEARDVSFRAGSHLILEHVSLRLHEEEILTLIGPNGAGKTSLLKILIGLAQPSSGSVWRREGLRVGYMPQKLQIDAALPLTAGRFLQVAERDMTRVRAVAFEVGVEALLKTPITAVSGGELQRLLLARALLRDPELLLLDEPVQGVDIAGQAELYALIREVRSRHRCAVLMISHDLHVVMASTDTVLCLNRHVCCAGRPEVVSNDPAYLQLFGRQAAEQIAVYTHHHDHAHDMHGNVIGEHHHHG
jgi:zinc transport system ATP-binding protein